jgi:hypothetical protein
MAEGRMTGRAQREDGRRPDEGDCDWGKGVAAMDQVEDQALAPPQPKPRKRMRWQLRVLLALQALALVLFVISRLEPEQAKGLGRVIEAVCLEFNPPTDPDISPAGREFITAVKQRGGQADLSEFNRGFLGHFGRVERFSVMFANSALDDEGLAQLARIHGDRIDRLYLCDTRVTDRGLRSLKEFPHLRNLQITSNRGLIGQPKTPSLITDAGIPYLNLPQITSLDLSGLPITDQGLKALAGLSELNSLYLRRTNVQGSSLGQFASLPSLRMLSLDQTAITDRELSQLAGASSLQWLSLSGNTLSAAPLKKLATLPSLTQLVLERCGLLDEEVAILKAVNPNLKIER